VTTTPSNAANPARREALSHPPVVRDSVNRNR
jgi:hypothetical protein